MRSVGCTKEGVRKGSGREGTAGSLGWRWILLWREAERDQPAEADG